MERKELSLLITNEKGAEITEKKFDSEKINICTTKSETSLGGILWVTTPDGKVYLLNKNLEVVENFPITLSELPTASSSATDDGIVISVNASLNPLVI